MYILRPRQELAVEKILTFLNSKSKKKGLFVYPTSFGKSLIIANVASKFPDKYFINVTNNKELLRQNYEKYISYGNEASLCSASLKSNVVGKVTFATIGTLAKHIDFFKDKEVIILDDEAQEGSKVGSQLDTFIRSVPNAKLIGLTATPFRLSPSMKGTMLKMMNRDRDCIYSSIEDVVQIQEVIAEDGWTKLDYRIRDIDEKELKLNTSGTDYTLDSIKKFNKTNSTISKCISEVRSLLKEGRKSILVSVPFIEDAKQMEEHLDCCKAVYSGMDTKERDKIIEGFKSLEIKVVVQCMILSVGFDHPQLDAMIMAKPSNSLTFVYQFLGRGVRKHPNKKDCVVVDLSGNCEKFGKIEDITIEDNEYTKGWAAFSGEKLITNYPLGNRVVPTRKSLKDSLEFKSKVASGEVDTSTIKIHFGKYNGKTVAQVFKENKNYLAWLASNKDFHWNGDKMKTLKVAIYRILQLPLTSIESTIGSKYTPEEAVDKFKEGVTLVSLVNLF